MILNISSNININYINNNEEKEDSPTSKRLNYFKIDNVNKEVIENKKKNLEKN